MAEPAPTAPGSARRDLAWIALAAAPGLAIAAARQIGVDFWYDEVRTLRQVVLVPLGVSATDYREPNNHVLFSILANLWCRLLGVGDLRAALESPAALRLLPFLLAAPGPILLGAAARRTLGVGAGAVAAALFASALPFANFACQFRGYGLGLTLVAAVLLLAVRWRAEGRRGDLVLLGVAGALAVWAIPLHLHALAAIALLHGAIWFGRLRRGGAAAERVRDLGLAAAAVAAGGVGLAFYLPCLGSVLSNHWSEPKGGPRWETIAGTLPPVLGAMLAGRWWLLAAFGGAAAALALRRGQERAAAGAFGWGTGLLLLPFLVSALRGDRPFDRVFLQVLPAFALAGAAAIRLSLGPWHGRRWVAPVAVAALAAGGWLALDARDRRLAEDIEAGVKSQSIERAYFHAHYRPREVLSSIAADPETARLPVTLGTHDREALPAYLAAAGVEARAAGTLAPGTLYIEISSVEIRWIQVLDANFTRVGGPPSGALREITPAGPSFDRVFLCECR